MGVGESDVNGLVLASLLLSHCCSVLAILDRKGIYVEDEPRRHYRLEDFLWSGSGDGEGSGEKEATWATTTIFRTTTILTTIYPTPVLPCPGDECGISPTPTHLVPGPSITLPPPQPFPDVPDQRYWLVTVIDPNSTAIDLTPSVFEQRLARLYRTAFNRQQEKHLKLNTNNEVEKKSVSRERRETVSVRVLRMKKNAKGNIVLVYTVRVAGKPVDAAVASEDMNLLEDHEVSSLLGFKVLTKAEPFQLQRKTDTVPETLGDFWFVVGASTTVVILILVIIIALLTLISKKKRKASGTRSQTSFSQKERSSGRENMGFQDDDDSIKEEEGDEQVDERVPRKDLSTPGRQPVTSPKPRPRSYKPSTPNSYLSMPSVKAFPRGAAKPGPLEEVLESTISRSGVLSRHSSESADPGVVGPLVWDLHCHRLNKKGENDEESLNADLSVGRMRRRFHELLDDAFSLFGSGSASPEEEASNTNNYGRSKSAVILPIDPLTSDKILRPKTTDAQRPSTAGLSRIPRGAWDASPPSTPTTATPLRPLSAGPFHTPSLEPAWILTDTSLKSTDPAVPVIKAIKSELDKFPYVIPDSYKT